MSSCSPINRCSYSLQPSSASPGTAVLLAANQASALPADVDDDTRRFFARMTTDISTLAMSVGRPSYGNTPSRRLGEALTASPATSAAAWRRFYVQVCSLVAVCAADAPVTNRNDWFTQALERLQQFLDENADLLDVRTMHDDPATIGWALA